jgi:RNA methyltransferase, TrmH family
MLTNNIKKYIKSLHLKKNREENREFLVEGKKSLIELLNSDFEVVEMFISEAFYKENKNLININYSIEKVQDLENISTLETNDS